jgi:hypothetical protein
MNRFEHIDLDYRPSSYFWAREYGIALTSDIKGAERRKIYEKALQQNMSNLVDPDLLQHTLTPDQRLAHGRLHPAFLGGEYLPDRGSTEVEIARITIASTTQDVTCVYARPVGQRIHYRVVDEYEGTTLAGTRTRTSTRPLTLVQLVDFFLSNWDLISCLDCNFEDEGHPRDQIHDFIIDAYSSFYAEFGRLVSARVDAWLDTLTPPIEMENNDD